MSGSLNQDDLGHKQALADPFRNIGIKSLLNQAFLYVYEPRQV